jgi:hypothetical protein
MMDIFYVALTAYIIACVVGASSLFEPMRKIVISKLPKLKIGNNKHFIECRLCLTFWSSCFAVILFGLSWKMILPVYGLSYFMATQER